MGAFLRDLYLVLKNAPGVERGRRSRGPAFLLNDLRARGSRGVIRTPRESARLAKIVRLVDACFPGGGNCYRRALLEIAIDPHAAAQPLRLGLRSGGGPRSGHAWIGIDNEAAAGRYDAEFSV
jgi:hypothetical protein